MTSHEDSLDWADETIARLLAMPLALAQTELQALSFRANPLEWNALLRALDARQRSLSPRPANVAPLLQWATTLNNQLDG